jgi:hypothetical protein
MWIWNRKDGGRRKITAAAVAIFAIGLPAGVVALSAALDDYEEDPIKYSASIPHDPITRLQQRIDSGLVKLKYDQAHGWLPAILRELKIPVSSQMLVFSKTSFQRDLISPDYPRALYFNDNSYIGWVQGGPVLEVSSVDPQLGAVFYVLRRTRLPNQSSSAGPTNVCSATIPIWHEEFRATSCARSYRIAPANRC